VVPDCQADAPRPDAPSAACATFLRASEKAQQQWELERRFKSFEASL
jgi:adenosine deaminase